MSSEEDEVGEFMKVVREMRDELKAIRKLLARAYETDMIELQAHGAPPFRVPVYEDDDGRTHR